ncbi:MAG: ribonuclease J [Bacillota bacterium]|nr:ribonuclease J [Bacillota bacterium]
MKQKDKVSASPLRIIPLGGLHEIDKNMTVYEYENDIIVVDCGLAFPENELLGIDIIIQDISYLKKNIDKVRALFVTHSHEDHIGAIPYFLREISVPIYATKFTLGLIKSKLKEHRMEPKTKTIAPGDKVKVGAFRIEAIRVNHSTPDAVAFAIKSPVGTVIQTGDFKIDHSPIDGETMQLGRLASLGEDGVLALLSDSTNATHEGYTMSESLVGKTFEEIFRNETKGRIIIASFASNVHRIQQIVNAAQIYERKIAFSGRSMVNVTNVAMELGYLKIPSSMLIDIKDIGRYPDNELVIVTTGSQGEPMSALTRMALSEHRNLEVQEGDVVILSSSPIPGNEKSVYRIINQLIQKGAKVIYDKLEEVHVSGHAKREELKMMLSLTKPKFFIPVHGEYMHLNCHRELAIGMGMSHSDIFLLRNGSVLELTENSAVLAPPVQAGRVFIDGLGIGDVGSAVLRERKNLSEDGIIIVTAAMRKDNGEIISDPFLLSRGFVYVKESEELMESARGVVGEEIQKYHARGSKDAAQLRTAIKESLSQLLYQKTKRGPMILVIFTEVPAAGAQA